jgi:outer membrane protein TolC
VRRRYVRHVLASAAIAAVALSIAGCASPLTDDYAGPNGSLTDGLIARAIMNGSYTSQVLQAPTQVGGVHARMPRVDSPGPSAILPMAQALVPSTVPSMSPPGAVVPATTTAPGVTPAPVSPAVAEANDINPTQGDTSLERGLAAATLNSAEPVFNLSLQDAIARAARNSLAIKVESYNPAIRESLIVQAEAAFDAVVFANSTFQNLDDPSLTPGASLANGQQWVNQIGIRKLLPSGGTASISTGFTYRGLPGDLGGNAFPPLPGQPSISRVIRDDLSVNNYQADINLQFSQPLLRGFGTELNQANIYLAQRDQRISLATFRRQVITQIANVEEAYWNLVLARTTVDIEERLVKASQQTFDLVWSRRQIDATKASINQALAALESRKADLMLTQRDFRQASDRLKTLLNDPELNVQDNILINPTDRPIGEPILYSTADCIETALRQRTEMQEARLQVEKSDILVRVAKNDLLPKLDLVTNIQTNGLDSSFDQAFSSTVHTSSVDFSAGIKLEFPLGNRAAEAELVQRKLERQQGITQIVSIAQQVVGDVKSQLRELLSQYTVIQKRDQQRIAAGLAFEGILDIEDIRARTPEFMQTKLDSQQNLATAEIQLTQALVSYNIAVMKLEQAKGTLLEFNRVSLDRPPITPQNDDQGKLHFMGRTYLKR